ncbi:hypothetical protein PoB_007329800 [Plakobranchus ocellatus]|uniref:Uncharacterized protein n=1 Tax=Plakobranchus ocellatus TaxID=259542 RepID=A0AAV4DRS9_9GAST|nr:hypothetical protein PoB_007329800 [Plakobranchus ocellatus]
MQRMRQLTRTAIYWSRIDTNIEDTARHCVAWSEHKRVPLKRHLILGSPQRRHLSAHQPPRPQLPGHDESFLQVPVPPHMSSISNKFSTRKLDRDFVALWIFTCHCH